MTVWLAMALLVAVGVGLALLVVQIGALWVHRRRLPVPKLTRTPRVTLLKPLCGLDDDLEENLTYFARLPYPDVEILLGVETTSDAAYPLALRMAERFPERMRVLVQRGTPGLNPKVNQLVTLGAEATGEILVISDSNSRAEEGFLEEIVSLFEDPQTGLVAHPVIGVGEVCVGAALDNLHIGSIGLGCVAAKRVAGQDVVVGKLMSVRRADLAELGGFPALANVLAEDFLLGRWVVSKLGKRVALAHRAVQSVTRTRTVVDFYRRYARWGVMQRHAVGNGIYFSQVLLNPVFVAFLALAVHPAKFTIVAFAATVMARTMIDGITGSFLRPPGFPLPALACSSLKDFMLALAWIHGLTHDTVVWRGHPIRVLPGTHLVPVDASALPGHAPAADAAAVEIPTDPS